MQTQFAALNWTRKNTTRQVGEYKNAIIYHDNQNSTFELQKIVIPESWIILWHKKKLMPSNLTIKAGAGNVIYIKETNSYYPNWIAKDLRYLFESQFVSIQKDIFNSKNARCKNSEVAGHV